MPQPCRQLGKDNPEDQTPQPGSLLTLLRLRNKNLALHLLPQKKLPSRRRNSTAGLRHELNKAWHHFHHVKCVRSRSGAGSLPLQIPSPCKQAHFQAIERARTGLFAVTDVMLSLLLQIYAQL